MIGFSQTKRCGALLFCMLTGVLAVSLSWADVGLPGVFGDHMVLQRDMKVPYGGPLFQASR